MKLLQKLPSVPGTGDAVGVLSDKDYTQFPRARFAWNIDKRGICLS
jgi:hypothetical protein